jgi:HEAT repeat protein
VDNREISALLKAAHLSRTSGDPAGVHRLAEILEGDAASGDREVAIRFLRRTVDSRTTNILLRYGLTDQNARLRGLAALALSERGNELVLPTLEELLPSPVVSDRVRVVKSLAHLLSYTRAQRLLVDALRDHALMRVATRAAFALAGAMTVERAEVSAVMARRGAIARLWLRLVFALGRKLRT